MQDGGLNLFVFEVFRDDLLIENVAVNGKLENKSELKSTVKQIPSNIKTTLLLTVFQHGQTKANKTNSTSNICDVTGSNDVFVMSIRRASRCIYLLLERTM